MKKMRRQLLSGLCATALVVGMMPGAIWASDAVTYLDMGELKTCESATLVTAEDTVWGANDGAEHWLVAEGDVTIDGRVAVAGDVSLILADGAMLVVDGGIDVPAGAGFTIYAQSDGDNQGILEAYGEEFSGEGSAGIGGNEEDVNFGDIVICGGLIYAEGGSRAAGIGGGGLYLNDDVVDGAVSIVDGDVYALGGQYAAGIGSGADSTNGSVCAIYDGKVVAASVDNGAGIGSGYGGSNQGVIFTMGGEISVLRTGGSAGIGGGVRGGCGEISIMGGDITVVSDEDTYGAGIGSGYASQEGGTIDIGYGTVTVPDDGAGAGVGSGSEGTCDEILIYGGSVTVGTGKATDSTYIQGAGIGSGCVSESEGTTAITILDGKITATGGTAEGDIGGAGIGSGGVGTPCAITITGGTIAATGGVQADDIGNGYDTTGSSFTTGENGHALITAETVLGGSVTVVPFVDVQPDDWYIDVVKYALENGLMTGVSETEFAPDLATTRGMVASVLYRLEGGPEAEDAGFSDVSADAWYADAVNWAASVGVVAGYGDAFGANDAITREQLAAILCNYAAYKGEDVSSGAALDGYSDAASVSDWAGESVEWAVAEGLLSGVTNNELAPQGSATRAQVAAMLQRFNAR